MPTIDFKSELFQEDLVATEAVAYRLLSASPVGQVNYFAAPWSALIRRRSLRMPALRLGGGFTVCQHAWFERIIPACLKLGLDTLFTPHVQPDTRGLSGWLGWAGRTAGLKALVRSRHEAARSFRILPFPHLSINGVEPQAKRLWYSFIGCDTHPVRRVIFDLPHRSNTLLKCRESWHFDVARLQREQEKHEYQEVLAGSRFSLGPRGYGPSTIRFWESLQAGAIPVLISDSMMLPAGFDWSSCVVRIAEDRAADVEEVLRNISPADEEHLRRCSLEASRRFSGPNLVSCIHYTYSGSRLAA